MVGNDSSHFISRKLNKNYLLAFQSEIYKVRIIKPLVVNPNIIPVMSTLSLL